MHPTLDNYDVRMIMYISKRNPTYCTIYSMFSSSNLFSLLLQTQEDQNFQQNCTSGCVLCDLFVNMSCLFLNFIEESFGMYNSDQTSKVLHLEHSFVWC
jgi:hypothetical protein